MTTRTDKDGKKRYTLTETEFRKLNGNGKLSTWLRSGSIIVGLIVAVMLGLLLLRTGVGQIVESSKGYPVLCEKVDRNAQDIREIKLDIKDIKDDVSEIKAEIKNSHFVRLRTKGEIESE